MAGMLSIGGVFGVLILLNGRTCAQDPSSWTSYFASCPEEKRQKSETKNDPIYLDVREDEEWAAGHVKDALHIKMSDILNGEYENIPRDQEVLVYCRSGRRSQEVINFLQEKGFTNLVNAGGLKDLEGVEILTGK